jgi:two-component system chemotaxis sensor kinase CheA
VLAIRNLRVASVFQRLAQLARDDARAAGKQVRIELRGTEVELDKAVLDALGGALVHLVRNAVVHGIEAPSERIAAGKAPEALLRLSAEASGGQVVLTLLEDGRGLDRAALAAKARERGLEASLPAEELIFAPGLSTAPLSTRAGRGVGMDAVRRSVMALGGQVEVVSREGLGTRITLTVPVTLALQRVLLVTLGEETFALPSTAVVETLDARPQRRRWLGGGEALEHRGSLVPLVDSREVLGVEGQTLRNVVVLESQGRAALMVDGLPGHQEFAFQSLDENLCPGSPASGAALSWDGRVVLRLDPGRLVRAARAAAIQQGAA